LEIVRIHCGRTIADELYMRIKRIFVLTTWIVLYPNEQQFFQKNRGDRLWLSIYHRKWAHSVPAGTTISLADLRTQKADEWVLNEFGRPKNFNFMYKWQLWADNKGRTMQAILALSNHWAHQNNTSIAEISEELESIWEEAKE
jgi:hypothetical protein